jgi:hypothetical protein
MRQQVKRIWQKNTTSAYSPEENKALEVATRGSTMENLMRKLGSFSPLRGPVSALGVSQLADNFPEVIIPITAVTHGAKILGDQLEKRNVNEASRVIRNMGQRKPVLPPPNKIQQGVKRATKLFPGIVGSVSVRGLLD